MTGDQVRAALAMIGFPAWDDRRLEAVRALDSQAKRDGTLEGRMVRFQVADNFATYVVTEACRRYGILKWAHGYTEPTIEAQHGKTTREYTETLVETLEVYR